MSDDKNPSEMSPSDVAAMTGDLDRRGHAAVGRMLRKSVPRSSIASWQPAADRPDPVEVIRATNLDRLPAIAPIGVGRMAADPFALLRGSAQMMAIDIGGRPTTGIEVQACGDAHLMNFGVFATTERNLVFDLNDFDETLPGAWEWDLERLAVSLVVAARMDGDTDRGVAAVHVAAESYRRRMRKISRLSALERRYERINVDDVVAALRTSNDRTTRAAPLERHVAKARARDRFHALDRLTELRDGRRAIVARPPLIQPLAAGDIRDDLLHLYESYCASLPDHVARLVGEYRFVDIAFKAVGVGSVGTRSFVVLLEGRVNGDPLFLQIKEAGRSAFAQHTTRSGWSSESQRIVNGQRLMQAAGDMFLGWGTAGGRDYYVRQLRDMKGSVGMTTIAGQGLDRYAHYCATALALAHGRSGSPAMISGYLGRSEKFDHALAEFAVTYADQNERDHAALVRAIKAGTIESISGV